MYFLQKKLMNVYSFFYLVKLMSRKLDSEKIYKIQNKNIRRLMKRAYKIPFYRKKFDECGLLPKDFNCAEDLLKFPVLTKQEIRNWIEPEIQKNPEKYKHWICQRTSGSSGNPLMTCVTPKENAVFNANWLRILMKNGLHPFGDKTLALKANAVNSDGIVQKLGLFRRKAIEYSADGEAFYNTFMAYQPECVYAHRSKLLEMILYAEKNNLPLYQPKIYCSISELLTPSAAAKMQSVLGEGLISSYGSIEVGACTYTKKGNTEKHYITSDTHVVNLVDDNNCFANEGRLVITNLFVKKFPIINYDIQDGATGFTEDNVRYIQRINGRANDWVKTPSGAVYNFCNFSLRFRYLINLIEILQFRVEQFALDDIRLYLVKNQEYRDVPNEELEEKIMTEFKELFKEESSILTIEWKEELPPDPNGKLRVIVNHIKE